MRGAQAVSDHGDGALAAPVEVDEGAPLRLGAPGRLDPHAELSQLPLGPVSQLVVAQSRQEEALAGELRELDRGHRSPAPRLLPSPARVHDLSGRGQPLDPSELDPFDVPDDGDPHPGRGYRRSPKASVSGGGGIRTHEGPKGP